MGNFERLGQAGGKRHRVSGPFDSLQFALRGSAPHERLCGPLT
jgi:hypothetical protein